MITPARAIAALVLAANAVACGSAPSNTAPLTSLPTGYTRAQDASCLAGTAQHTPQPGVHVAVGATLAPTTNPPSSGEHYPFWAAWGVATRRLQRGVYVHNLEHGGVALLYRCDGDCDARRRALEAFVAALPDEPSCAAEGVARRVVLTEDPEIPAPVAAAAWGWTYLANCVDAASLRAFVLAHTGQGPEDICAGGG